MRTLKVAAIQTGPCADDSRANLARGLRLLRQAKREHGVDFAVFNELFNIKFFAVKEMDRFDQAHILDLISPPITARPRSGPAGDSPHKGPTRGRGEEAPCRLLSEDIQ